MNNLNIIILGSGYAKRLKPISDFMPKPLLYIDGVPLLNHILRPLLELEYEKIIVSSNKKFENSFRYWMSTLPAHFNGKNLKIYLSVDPSTCEENKLGAIGTLYNCIKMFNLDMEEKNDLLIILGDNLFDFDLKEFISYAKRFKKIFIGAYDIKDINEAKKYGVLIIDKIEKNIGRVREFEEKPENPKSTLVSVGIYFIPNKKIKKIEEYINAGLERDVMGRFIEWLVKKDEVNAYIFDGTWFDIGTPETYIKANEWASSYKLGRRWLWP